MTDETLRKLEALLVYDGKPDQRTRWTRQLIERLKVTERAMHIILANPEKGTADKDQQRERWHNARQEAIRQLRAEGVIRG